MNVFPCFKTLLSSQPHQCKDGVIVYTKGLFLIVICNRLCFEVSYESDFWLSSWLLKSVFWYIKRFVFITTLYEQKNVCPIPSTVHSTKILIDLSFSLWKVLYDDFHEVCSTGHATSMITPFITENNFLKIRFLISLNLWLTEQRSEPWFLWFEFPGWIGCVSSCDSFAWMLSTWAANPGLRRCLEVLSCSFTQEIPRRQPGHTTRSCYC